MEVIVAKTAGFCFGVKRAVEQVYEQITKAEKPVYTYGPIIHNEFVVKDLEKKGVCPEYGGRIICPYRWNCGDPLPWRRKAYL